VKVLVTRTDRLGDLVLSLPVFALLKQACPAWEIHALVAPGSVPLVENDPHLSRVWTWNGDEPEALRRALQTELAACGFDAAVMLQYRRELAVLLRAAGIRRRYGPWSRWSSWLNLNRGRRQNRSGGGRHEMDFNLDLGRCLLADEGVTPPRAVQPLPQLHLCRAQKELAACFRREQAPAASRIAFVHPGSGGSALDWEPARFDEVANVLAADRSCRVFVTGAGSDAPAVGAVSDLLVPAVTVLLDRYPLREFLAVLSTGNLFVGPSTGPLHMASALAVPTLGLFPPVRTMYPDRWGARGEGGVRGRSLLPDVSCPARRDCRGNRCPHYNCLNGIRVETVLAAARDILAQGLS
jgi:ADP-heptose:LPS heptosyltransferase